MDVAQIDETLQRYSLAEGRIGANLHELEIHSTYQILKTDKLRGTTSARIGPALQAADELWSMFGLFRDALAKARKIRGTGNRLGGSERAQLTEMLTTPSVVVRTAPTPLGERDLLDDGHNETKMSFEQIMARMRALYVPLRDGVAKVDDVLRDILPRLDAAHETLSRADAEAAALGVVEPDLRAARDRLDEVRRLSIDDPLALGSNAGSQLDRMATSAAQRVAQLRQGHDRLHSDLASMEGLIAEIRTLRARAAAAWTETQKKIAAPTGLVRVPGPMAIDGPRGLSERAASISSGPSSSWQAQRESLDLWLDSTRRLRDQLVRAERANRSPLDRRDELRGLLSAYEAKIARLGRSDDQRLDNRLENIVDEAQSELFTAPTDLVRAEQLVRDLASAITSSARTQGAP